MHGEKSLVNQNNFSENRLVNTTQIFRLAIYNVYNIKEDNKSNHCYMKA